MAELAMDSRRLFISLSSHYYDDVLPSHAFYKSHLLEEHLSTLFPENLLFQGRQGIFQLRQGIA